MDCCYVGPLPLSPGLCCSSTSMYYTECKLKNKKLLGGGREAGNEATLDIKRGVLEAKQQYFYYKGDGIPDSCIVNHISLTYSLPGLQAVTV